MKKYILILTTAFAMLTLFLIGCSNDGKTATKKETTSSEKQDLDYLVLINKTNKIPSDWSKKVQLDKVETVLGDEIEVEKETLRHFHQLQGDCAADGVYIEIEDCYRSIEAQEATVKNFTDKYGADYTKKYVAVPGYSEHHSGLAVDVCLRINGEIVNDNDEMISHPEIWNVVFSKLADHGFILRYPEGKDDITGYSYEPWHLRFVGSKENAEKIVKSGLTFDEYMQ